MLAKIREKTQGIIATLILSFLAIPFVLWGIGSYFEGNTSVAVAKVNGVEISQQAYRQRLDELRALDPRRADSAPLKDMILNSMIEQTLVVSHAEERGYRMSDAQLKQTIHDIPYFQQDGKFNAARYDALLRQQGLRVPEFESRLRNENVTAQLERGLRDTAFVTDAEIIAVARLLKQERRVTYAVVGPDAFIAKTSVSGPEIEEFYQANQESFRTEEAVRVESVTLKASEMAANIKPTEEELRQAYSAEGARFVTPEKRTVSHILITVPAGADDNAEKAVRERAEGIAKQIRAGGDFAALAKKHSEDKESAAKGGDLGVVTAGLLPNELQVAVNALKVGEITGAVRTSYGYHVAKLTAYQPERRQSFESVKNDLTEQVRRRKSEERFYELAERFRNLAYEHAEGLQPVAKELGLTVQISDWFTRQNGTGVAADARIRTAAFESDVLARQRNSDVIELNPETLVAVHVTEHRPSVVRPLSEVRAQIERTLKERQAREQAKALAAQWVEKVSQGAKLSDLARTINATVQAGKMLTRENPAGIDRRLADAIFASSRPTERPVVGQVELGNQGYAVYALESVRDIDPSTIDAAQKDKLRQQLAQRRGADYYASHRAGLRKAADITINKDQL